MSGFSVLFLPKAGVVLKQQAFMRHDAPLPGARSKRLSAARQHPDQQGTKVLI